LKNLYFTVICSIQYKQYNNRIRKEKKYVKHKILVRFSMISLSKSMENCNWHVFTVSVLEVLNNFMKNLFITKSGDFKSNYIGFCF